MKTFVLEWNPLNSGYKMETFEDGDCSGNKREAFCMDLHPTFMMHPDEAPMIRRRTSKTRYPAHHLPSTDMLTGTAGQ